MNREFEVLTSLMVRHLIKMLVSCDLQDHCRLALIRPGCRSDCQERQQAGLPFLEAIDRSFALPIIANHQSESKDTYLKDTNDQVGSTKKLPDLMKLVVSSRLQSAWLL